MTQPGMPSRLPFLLVLTSPEMLLWMFTLFIDVIESGSSAGKSITLRADAMKCTHEDPHPSFVHHLGDFLRLGEGHVGTPRLAEDRRDTQAKTCRALDNYGEWRRGH